MSTTKDATYLNSLSEFQIFNYSIFLDVSTWHVHNQMSFLDIILGLSPIWE